MSFRKCEFCKYDLNGYCPYNYACKLSAFFQYRNKRLGKNDDNNINHFRSGVANQGR